MAEGLPTFPVGSPFSTFLLRIILFPLSWVTVCAVLRSRMRRSWVVSVSLARPCLVSSGPLYRPLQAARSSMAARSRMCLFKFKLIEIKKKMWFPRHTRHRPRLSRHWRLRHPRDSPGAPSITQRSFRRCCCPGFGDRVTIQGPRAVRGQAGGQTPHGTASVHPMGPNESSVHTWNNIQVRVHLDCWQGRSPWFYPGVHDFLPQSTLKLDF